MDALRRTAEGADVAARLRGRARLAIDDAGLGVARKTRGGRLLWPGPGISHLPARADGEGAGWAMLVEFLKRLDSTARTTPRPQRHPCRTRPRRQPRRSPRTHPHQSRNDIIHRGCPLSAPHYAHYAHSAVRAPLRLAPVLPASVPPIASSAAAPAPLRAAPSPCSTGCGASWHDNSGSDCLWNRALALLFWACAAVRPGHA